MTSNMTIGKKLMLAFGAMLALTLGLAWSSLSSVSSLGKELDTEINSTAKKTELAMTIQASAMQIRAGVRGQIMYSVFKDPAKVEPSKEMLRLGLESIRKSITELRPLVAVPAAKQALENMEATLVAWQPVLEEIGRSCANQRFDAELQQNLTKSGELLGQIDAASSRLMQVQKELTTEAAKEADSTTTSSRWMAIVLIGLCLAVGAGVVFMVRQISASLRHVVEQMADSGNQVASAANQVSSSSQALAQGASEQAASLEETSASTEEIHSMTQKNASNSKSAAEFMSEAATKVNEANHVVDQMVDSMREINASSDKVAKIIKVIDEIAFQTNILALNAAVEAARAGEAGMGFAVVADEVRNLAQRCAQAAKDTAGLIEESIAKSNDGKTKLDQVTVAIHSITESSNAVKTLVDEVNVGSQEQARGIEQIAKAVTQMEQVTQKTAASAEEGASASEQLSAQAQTMHAVVAELQQMVGGGGGAALHTTMRRPSAVRTGSVAVAARPHAPAHAAEPVSKPTPSSIPLDDDFKEF